MLDILAEALMELLGVKPPPKQQPRRRPAQPARSQSGGDAPPPPPMMTREELMRRISVMGKSIPPAPVRQQPAPAEPPKKKPGVARPTPAPRPRPQPSVAMKPVRQPAAMAPARPQQQATGLDFVAKLRNNPEAARQAFVLSEIFGRPLADR